MGFLSFKPDTSLPLRKLPSGSFTVDSSGNIVTSTVPTSFPASQVDRIARLVLNTFERGHEAGYPFAELIIHYAAFKLNARELRGGAIVFLSPQRRAS
jgi:hypothetical protein